MNLQLFTAPVTTGEVQTMSSREIAELTGSTHDNVLKTVRALVERGVVFKNETLYTHPQNGQQYPEFLLNYRDSMVVVSGYSPELRAKIIDRWQELEAEKAAAKTPAPAIIANTALTNDIAALDLLARVLNVADSGKLGMMRVAVSHHAPHLLPALPSYAIDAPQQGATVSGSSEPTFSLTHLLQEHGVAITAAKFNAMLHDAHIIEKRTRKSTAGTKQFWSVTDKGLPFGKNVSSDKNQRETQPHWYASKFAELLNLVLDMH